MIAHLWQSTAFALAAGLLALVLRRNGAKVRYRVWLAASVKFLIPFAVLVELGSHVAWRHSADVTPMQVTASIEAPADSPILPPPLISAPATGSTPGNPAILYAVWAAGTLLVAGRRWIEWRSIRRAVRAAAPLDLALPIRAVCSREFAEPGLFGIFRPVLLLPEGIREQLSVAQFDAMIAHELAHLRRRDNLATALHMAVEAAFWFHPLVWWIGGRLLEERERACDEEVLRSGSTAEEYAEGILRMCELYVASPRIVSGITGSNLKRRIEQIVSGSAAVGLSAAKKSALAAAGAAAVLAPLLAGMWNAPAIQAQSDRPAVKFEVESVKPCQSAGDDGAGRGGKKGVGGGRLMRWAPDRLHWECGSVANMIRDAYLAYPEGKPWRHHTREEPSASSRGGENRGCLGCGQGVPPYSERYFRDPIKGAPAWTESDRYTIDAKAESPSTPEMMRGPMMQALLEKRFQLKLHREGREVPVYELSVAAGGAKLTPSTEGSCEIFDPTTQPDRFKPGAPMHRMCGSVLSPASNPGTDFPGTSLAGLCRYFSMMFDRDVVDKTGITGLYEIHVDAKQAMISEPRPPDDDGPHPAVTDRGLTAKRFQAALPKIGLKLTAAKGTAAFLVIDHVERPTPN
jgi:uncharacterized protein (TIGR03435 family)